MQEPPAELFFALGVQLNTRKNIGMKPRIILLLVTICILPGSGRTAYLESDFNGARVTPSEIQPPPRIIPPPPPKPPRPVHDFGIRRFVQDLSAGSPTQYGNLTVFPLYHPAGNRDRGYLTMDEALRHGDLEIRERGRGVVSEVVATNRSGSLVLLLAGEIVVGGKQNRILRRDVLLAPWSREVVIPAYCVERGRWTPASGGRFEETPQMGSHALRRFAAEGRSQGEIWNEVSELGRKHSYSSPTDDLSGLYEQPGIRERMEEYRRGFHPILRSHPVGVVICREGRIVSAEFFVDSHLFRDYWPRILDSHVIDLPPRFPRRRPGWEWPDRQEVQRFLNRIEHASFHREHGPGTGTGVRISAPGLHGRSLVHREQPVHTTADPDLYMEQEWR
jgi:hypothetical protein